MYYGGRYNWKSWNQSEYEFSYLAHIRVTQQTSHGKKRFPFQVEFIVTEGNEFGTLVFLPAFFCHLILERGGKCQRATWICPQRFLTKSVPIAKDNAGGAESCIRILYSVCNSKVFYTCCERINHQEGWKGLIRDGQVYFSSCGPCKCDTRMPNLHMPLMDGIALIYV